MLSEWLQEALKLTDLSQVGLASELTRLLGRSIDRAAVNKMLTGERKIKGDELIAIEEITGLQAPKVIMVPLVGKIGAGQAVYALDSGEIDRVSAPASSRPKTVALRVDGDSMHPAYEEGELLYYSEAFSDPKVLINRRCIVKLADERIYVKILRQGSTLDIWTLQSLNIRYPDIEDVVVDWVAKIDWVKPRP